MIFALALATVVAPQPTSSLPDEVRFEMIVHGGKPSGFRIDATDQVELFDGHPLRRPGPPEVRQIRGSFARAAAQLAPYRARTGDSCAPTQADILFFRLTWLERGVLYTATFADSCGGIPTDLIDSVRPIAALLEPEPPEGVPIILEPSAQ